MLTRWVRAVVVLGLAGWLAGCGGGGSDETTTPTTAAPTVGSAGGTVSEASGATVVVPAGALDAETTLRVAMDSTGAPALPAGLVSAGSTYVITPHGGAFAQPVEVRIPVPAVALQPNQELKLAKADPGGEWVVLGDSTVSGSMLSASVNSFSFFTPIIISYPLQLAQLQPLGSTGRIDCGDESCNPAGGPVVATFTATSNNGQTPVGCSNPSIVVLERADAQRRETNIPLTGASSITRTTSVDPRNHGSHSFQVALRCSESSWFHTYYGYGSVVWRTPLYPAIGLANIPQRLDVVEGLSARLDAILHGGASKASTDGTQWAAPTASNRAVIDWQRSDDNGASWRVVARSFQDEANPRPYGSGGDWQFWSVRHGFVATSTDQGALIRLHACYTPPDVAPPPCVTSSPTRLNVLQQSAQPSITGAPRSVLVRTGQTASLSAIATGAPAPTLQWQSRPANSSGAWTDVSTGSGATTGTYTTAVLTTADNGVQYRVVATNALGSADSAPVNVSVSDIDEAPTITTQPGSLNVSTGNDAAFAIAARGTEALSYQWRFNGIPISGANSPVLRLPAVSAASAGDYSIEVNNGAGSVTSALATLSVSAGAAPTVAPSIVTQPVAVAINAGNSATFAVGVSGTGPFSYQWLRDGQAIIGATAAFHSLPQAASGDAASYAVQVSNSAGSVTSIGAQLTVNPNVQAAPVFLVTHPSPQVQAPGGSATFAVSLTGSGPISYQWLRNGTPIAGATTAVLTLVNVTSSDAAGYTVTVSNPRR